MFFALFCFTVSGSGVLFYSEQQRYQRNARELAFGEIASSLRSSQRQQVSLVATKPSPAPLARLISHCEHSAAISSCIFKLKPYLVNLLRTLTLLPRLLLKCRSPFPHSYPPVTLATLVQSSLIASTRARTACCHLNSNCRYPKIRS